MNIAELPRLNDLQRAAATAPIDLPLLVLASAGTGKTTLLVARVEHLISSGVHPAEVLVLVFTKLAAKEARERLQLSNINALTVGTFHSFGMRVVRTNYKAMGFKALPKIISDDKACKQLVREAMHLVKITQFLENACIWLEIPLQGASWDTVADEIKDTHPELYGYYDANSEYPPNGTPMDITQSQGGNTPSGKEITPVPEFGTHPSALKFDHRIDLIKAFYVALIKLRDEFWLLPSAVASFKEPDEESYEKTVNENFKSIQNAKTRGYSPGQFQGEFQAVYQTYGQLLLELNSVDFNDLLFLVHNFLRLNPRAVEQIKDRYKYILCDEAQDLNPLQLSLTLMLSSNGRLTYVGDDAQSIYRFRGSESWTMDAIENLHLEINPQVRRVLNLNYRSTQNILDVATVILGNAASAKELIAVNGVNPKDPPVTIVETGVEQDEAEYVRKQIQQHHAAGVPYKQMAFLYRKKRDFLNSSFGPLKAELDRFNIPNKLLAERSLLNRVVVKDIKAYLTLALNPHDDAAFLEVVNRPRRGFGAGAENILKTFQEANPVRMSYFSCVDPLCESGLLSEAQAEGLRSFAKTLLILYYNVIHRDPAEFVYFVLKKTKYVLWAETISRRKNAVQDDPDQVFDYNQVLIEHDVDFLVQEQNEFLREILPEKEEEEESYDDSGSSSSEDDEVELEMLEKYGSGATDLKRRSSRRLSATENIQNPQIENDEGENEHNYPSIEEIADERNYRKNMRLFEAADSFKDDDDDDDDENEEEEEDSNDPLRRYNFDLSQLKATTSPLRRLLREAANFTQEFRFKGNETEMTFVEQQIGPPSLQRIAIESGASDPELCRQFHADDKVKECAELLRLGPAVLMEFLEHVFQTKQDASTLDSNNVILSTIHGSKGLEWDVVFLSRFNKDTIPMYQKGDRSPLFQPAPLDVPLIQNYEPPARGNFHEENDLEERRLGHVGATRARKKLYITCIRYLVAKYDSHKVENPSILIEDIINHFIIRPPPHVGFGPRGPRRQVVEVIRMPETFRERCVGRLWFTDGTEAHPHSIWRHLEEQEEGGGVEDL